MELSYELLDYYYKAVKKGNPNAAVAFNNGVFPDVLKYYPHYEELLSLS